MSVFLSQEEVAELTGIKRGRDGKSAFQLQSEHLRKYGIPFFPNAAGRPIVAKAAVEGGVSDHNSSHPKTTTWRSAVLNT